MVPPTRKHLFILQDPAEVFHPSGSPGCCSPGRPEALPQCHYNIISCWPCLWGSPHPTGSSHRQALGPRQKVCTVWGIEIETSPALPDIPSPSHIWTNSPQKTALMSPRVGPSQPPHTPGQKALVIQGILHSPDGNSSWIPLSALGVSPAPAGVLPNRPWEKG